MKNFKRILLCFVFAFTLGLTFTACGKDPKQPPKEEPEVFTTVSLSFEEYETLIAGLDASLPAGFTATHETTYLEDSTTDTATQIINISGEAISSYIEVEGDTNYKGYLLDNYVYYEDNENKYQSLYIYADEHPTYKTTIAYNYINYLLSPVSPDLECHIYDGSLFEMLKDVYSSREEDFTFKKIFSTKHTNIEITYTGTDLQATFTLYFTGTTFTGVDMYTKNYEFERTSKITASSEQIQFPSFDDFIVENTDESVDDTWSPDN